MTETIDPTVDLDIRVEIKKLQKKLKIKIWNKLIKLGNSGTLRYCPPIRKLWLVFNILQADFVPILFLPKISNPNCKHMKTAQNNFVQKSCQ
jgi:hypothetical protein